MLARLYEREGRQRSAQDALRKLVSRRDPHPAHLAAQIDYLLRHDRPADATLWLEQLVRIEPHNPRTVQLRVRQLVARHDLEGASRVVDDFVTHADSTSQTDGSPIDQLAADMYAQIGRDDKAEQHYRSLIARTTDGYRAYAQFLASRNRCVDAVNLCLNAYKQSQQIEPLIALCTVTSALSPGLQVRDRRIDDALDEALEEALITHANSVRLAFNVATLRQMKDDQREAERLYRRVLELDENYAPALNNLAILLATRNAASGGRNATSFEAQNPSTGMRSSPAGRPSSRIRKP
jgi:tetratricopeptide (TPR) repeat protein